MFSNSNYIDSVDHAFIFIVAISFILLVFITGLMIYFVIKYSRKNNPKAENIHGNLKLEIFWTVVPVFLVMGMFYFGWVGYADLQNPPPESMKVKVVGQMWKWYFDYENGVRTDTLFVPINKPVKVEVTSIDVNHSFFVPAFRFKKDAIPNRINTAWFKPEELGSFDVACAEYCGLKHAYMYTEVVVMTEADFLAKMESELAKKNIPAPTEVKTDK
ncbi:MAG: cytochrome c oxidase subunit II [Chlorobiaceae bacterium]|nr:cytochrome c oxidase subunit II [Chlorobiaceae bacterium]MBA4309002.1 cytochrome c oxidase subunit II [Chlorobiaceae bacterium]